MSQTEDSATQVREDTPFPEVQVASNEAGNLPAPSEDAAKVELDIEDAPFLKEEAQVEEKVEEKEAEGQKAEDATKKSKKKKILLIGAGALFVIVAGLAAYFFFFQGPSVPPPPPPKPPEPNVIVVPSKPTVHVVPDVVVNFEPFIIPVGTSIGNTQFLVCKFSTVSKSVASSAEIEQKLLILRDSVYFYLRGKEADYLLDSNNAQAIKQDLVAILNDYLARGKLEDVLYDTYLAQ